MMSLFRMAPFALASMTLLAAIAPRLARAAEPDGKEQPLWPGQPPGALGSRPRDIPTLTAYLPAASERNGASILILPGGGYEHLAPHEGKGYAAWFAAHGIAAYVLKYRLGSAGYRYPVIFEDAVRAMRTVRAFARRDGLDPHRVGIIGSSAGGHLAAMVLTHFDAGKADAADPIERESSRPDLGILCYPVITMGSFTHRGSRKNFIGAHPAAALVGETSTEQHVTRDTPPTFLWCTSEDKTVPPENTLAFTDALRRAGVPYSVHIFEKGPHGLGMGRPGHPAPPWTSDLLYWLHERKFIP